MSPDRTRALTRADLDWVVEVSRRRREALVHHAPTFWRPADDATEKHTAFLAHLIDEPTVFTIRNGHGFLIALRQGSVWLVDDAGVAGPGSWTTDGVSLLRHAREHCGALRFVVPVFETARMEAATEVGLAPVEHWWHRDLPGSTPTSHQSQDDQPQALSLDGAAGSLVQAPPVYNPGGPVLLVTEVESASALGSIELEACKRGAPVSVVTQQPTNLGLASLLTDAGYTLTTAFCEATDRVR